MYIYIYTYIYMYIYCTSIVVVTKIIMTTNLISDEEETKHQNQKNTPTIWSTLIKHRPLHLQ